MPIETKRQEEYLEANPQYRDLAEAYYWSAPFGETTYNRPVFWLPTAACFPNAWNPNVEAPKTFDGLVANISEVGFSQNIQVIDFPRIKDQVEKEFPFFTDEWRADKFKWVDKWEFMIIGGEHRVNAAVFKDMDILPCVVMVDMDSVDYAEFQTMRFNLLSGSVDPEKFTKMTARLLASEQYSKPLLATMMGFTDQKAFDKLFLQARQSLPKPLRKKLDKVKADIKTIDQLGKVLHNLLATHGNDLSAHSFMMFALDDRMYLMVNMDVALTDATEWLVEHVRGLEDGDMAQLFTKMIGQYKEGAGG